MFDNVGKKIKKAARVLFVMGLVADVLLSILWLAVELVMGDIDPLGVFALFVVFLVVGSLLTYLCNLLLYGFGELVDKTSCTEEKVEGL